MDVSGLVFPFLSLPPQPRTKFFPYVTKTFKTSQNEQRSCRQTNSVDCRPTGRPRSGRLLLNLIYLPFPSSLGPQWGGPDEAVIRARVRFELVGQDVQRVVIMGSVFDRDLPLSHLTPTYFSTLKLYKILVHHITGTSYLLVYSGLLRSR